MKKQPTAEQKAQWAAEREDKVRRAKETLDRGVQQMCAEGDWRKELEKIAACPWSKLSPRRLSFRNQILVACQRQDATMVGTFAAWQRLGRFPRKGEKGIVVLQPVVLKREKENKQGEKEQIAWISYRHLHLFDVGQTEGKELPEPATLPRVGQDAGALAVSVDALKHAALGLEWKDESGNVVSPVREVEVRERRAGDVLQCNGWYNFAAKAIVVISTNRTPVEQFKTLVHEIAHAILHGTTDQQARHSRAQWEVEAESVAYVVCATLGLDVGDYSFPYINTWVASGQESVEESLVRSGDRIVKASNTILGIIAGSEVEELEDAA